MITLSIPEKTGAPLIGEIYSKKRMRKHSKGYDQFDDKNTIGPFLQLQEGGGLGTTIKVGTETTPPRQRGGESICQRQERGGRKSMCAKKREPEQERAFKSKNPFHQKKKGGVSKLLDERGIIALSKPGKTIALTRSKGTGKTSMNRGASQRKEETWERAISNDAGNIAKRGNENVEGVGQGE